MAEDAVNFAEFSAEKRAEGALKIKRILLVVGYILFVGAAFLICYLSRIIPLFAVAPIFLWILIYISWRYVSYDVAYTFESGTMVFSRIYANRTKRLKKELLTVQVKDAKYVGYLSAIESREWREQLKIVYDFLPSKHAEDAVLMVTKDDQGVLFVCPADVRKLLRRFCKAQKLG